MRSVSGILIRKLCMTFLTSPAVYSHSWTIWTPWYTLQLLSSRTSPSIPMPSYGLTKRGIRFLLLAIVFKIWGHYKEYETSKDVKYLWSANHAHSSGWGNVMQDYVMNALLAHTTGRSFVFDDYIWRPDGTLFTDYNGHLIPSRIPLTALLGGIIVGGEMPPGDTTPRAVSKDFFNKVCPNPTVVHVTEVNDDRMRFDESVPASYIFEKWLEKINSIEDPCVEIDPKSDAIFEYWIFGHERMLSIWKYLKDSPVSTHWGWSPLIHDAYRRNRHIFVPNAKSTFFEGLSGSAVTENYTAPIPGLLALHVRRGDFQDPLLVQVRVESEEPLTHVYIMTNGAVAWIKSSRDLDITWEQKFVVQALDMLVAQRSEVFIGNGWSSLTSNVVMLRMAQSFPPDSNRFW
ncbi:hypothetical protein DFJ58DRAFT_821029 [Suillus subalutaceus]|uniref:uncharacterized protein n=1 Tax=Suillus subalutaceus TaxID=48586 RepID=UPI001B86011F|nr:uncharacterized protein DFJ58DRAFT_821029 [Suillus subalutaceus]KAG1835005.1 hypothetical protein DFJ58DRAFT_821029 [Suillus subalutaceus]